MEVDKAEAGQRGRRAHRTEGPKDGGRRSEDGSPDARGRTGPGPATRTTRQRRHHEARGGYHTSGAEAPDSSSPGDAAPIDASAEPAHEDGPGDGRRAGARDRPRRGRASRREGTRGRRPAPAGRTAGAGASLRRGIPGSERPRAAALRPGLPETHRPARVRAGRTFPDRLARAANPTIRERRGIPPAHACPAAGRRGPGTDRNDHPGGGRGAGRRRSTGRADDPARRPRCTRSQIACRTLRPKGPSP